MPKVARLEELEGGGNRRRVVFDDGSSVELAPEVALSAGLLPGRSVSRASVERARRDDGLRAAEKDALRLLSTKDRSQAELRKELARRGHGEEAIAATVERCRRWGYLDDGRLAGQIVTESLGRRKLGPARVRRTLRERGIDEATAASALANSRLDEPSLVEQALAALKPKLRSYGRLEPQVARRRMVAFLQRRGFDFATVRKALAQLGHELDAEAGEQ